MGASWGPCDERQPRGGERGGGLLWYTIILGHVTNKTNRGQQNETAHTRRKHVPKSKNTISNRRGRGTISTHKNTPSAKTDAWRCPQRKLWVLMKIKPPPAPPSPENHLAGPLDGVLHVDTVHAPQSLVWVRDGGEGDRHQHRDSNQRRCEKHTRATRSICTNKHARKGEGGGKGWSAAKTFSHPCSLPVSRDAGVDKTRCDGRAGPFDGGGAFLVFFAKPHGLVAIGWTGEKATKMALTAVLHCFTASLFLFLAEAY